MVRNTVVGIRAMTRTTRQHATEIFLRGGLIALAVVLLGGLLSVLHYFPGLSGTLAGSGLDFAAVRPIHTIFASAWIFLAAITVIYRYLQDEAPPATTGEQWRLRAQVVLWGLAGVGILATLLGGITSGREYIGFHPLFSVVIMTGWLLFAWTFFSLTGRGFFQKPVYVTMWGVGILLFIYTFAEQHAWLLPGVSDDPIVDMRIQWKATGTLVGSFNLLVYGCLYYLASKMIGDDRYAHSKLAYALFGIGLLNSFVNFGHHTYHLPQSAWINWISFLVSMSEIVILARVIWDIAKAVKRRTTRQAAASFFLAAARWWIFAMLFTAILLSIPPINSILHGTYAVAGHAMGTEIGIDTMILLAAAAWILAERTRETPALRRVGIGFNISAATLVLWLTIAGCAVGFTRYQRMPVPDWVATANPTIFASTGIATAVFLAAITALMARAIWSRPTRAATKEIPVIEVQRIVLAQGRSTPTTKKKTPPQEPAATR